MPVTFLIRTSSIAEKTMDQTVDSHAQDDLDGDSSSTSSAPTSPVRLTEDNEWQDVEPDDIDSSLVFVSLLDDETFSTLNAMLDHCRDAHGLDLRELVRRFGVCVSLSFMPFPLLLN